jgi:hypothetical protein
MELPKANFSQQCWIQKIPGGRAAVFNALEDNAFHLPTGPDNPFCSESGNRFLGATSIEGTQGELDGADF